MKILSILKVSKTKKKHICYGCLQEIEADCGGYSIGCKINGIMTRQFLCSSCASKLHLSKNNIAPLEALNLGGLKDDATKQK